ncbi:MAG: GNAT family N-acetyltransferase [Planctomycetota bacterium]
MTELLLGREASALALMERVLRDGDPLAAEYPLVFDARFSGRILALGDGGEVRSACATLVRDFVVPGGTIRGGLIGSVSTQPEWQGHGLGTRLLVEAEAKLQAQGCVFALLWGEDPRFYLARGYCPVGAEEDFVVPSALVPALPAGAARPLAPSDAAAVHALYERHPVRLVRTAAETAALLACPGMTSLVLERDGGVVAYACRGRGGDLAEAIHEWGGSDEDVLALVRAHLVDRFLPGEEGELFLMAPVVAEELRARLIEVGAEHRRGILGLGKLLDRRAALEVLRPRLAPAGTIELQKTSEGPMFRLAGPARRGLLDDDGLLALLLPATEVRPEVAHLLAEFGLTDARLPLEAFVWGLDSI